MIVAPPIWARQFLERTKRWTATKKFVPQYGVSIGENIYLNSVSFMIMSFDWPAFIGPQHLPCTTEKCSRFAVCPQEIEWNIALVNT